MEGFICTVINTVFPEKLPAIVTIVILIKIKKPVKLQMEFHIFIMQKVGLLMQMVTNTISAYLPA
jgi:hypothetical protein